MQKEGQKLLAAIIYSISSLQTADNGALKWQSKIKIYGNFIFLPSFELKKLSLTTFDMSHFTLEQNDPGEISVNIS